MKEKGLAGYLHKGEQVRWHGTSKDFPLLAKDTKTQIIVKWIAAVVLCGGFDGLYIKNNPEFSMGMVCAVLLIGVLVVASPFLEKRKVLGQEYWITDERAILRTKDGSFFSVKLDGLDAFRLVKDKTQEGTLVLGGLIFEDINRQLRWRACHPKTDVQSDGAADEAQGLVFYNVGDSKAAADCLRQQVSQAA